MPVPGPAEFVALIRKERARRGGFAGTLAAPVCVPLLDDQLTPVLAYRRLVAPDERAAPSFLLESVEGGERQGRHSILGAQPVLEVVARRSEVRTIDHRPGGPGGRPRETVRTDSDPLGLPRSLSSHLRLVVPDRGRAGGLPACFLGGWVGYAAYDSVRYAEPGKLGWERAPPDDRGLPDLHFAFYDGVVVFDHVDKVIYAVKLVEIAPRADDREILAAHAGAGAWLEGRVRELQADSKHLASGRLDRVARETAGSAPPASNMTRGSHGAMVTAAKKYIAAGDIFQVVLGQRFERRSRADPFDVYRALRAVNPSPYMVYLQARGCILVASSPEILCRVRGSGVGDGGGRESGVEGGVRTVTNRPLAGTRRRGTTPEEDRELERELLADPKELAEHVMLVDLGRNDVGRVAVPGSIRLPAVLGVERYSHVMHISSTVTGTLRPGLDPWDALRAALPAGTISGAPKVRAMQIIDELEPVRRGPYGGGMGYVGLDGEMDIALALRTMVVPVAARGGDGSWLYHLQAAGGIVADSDAGAEYQETVTKAAALARAIDVAESAFGA